MHLSEVNNAIDVALKTVNNSLESSNVVFQNIICAEQDNISEVITL